MSARGSCGNPFAHLVGLLISASQRRKKRRENDVTNLRVLRGNKYVILLKPTQLDSKRKKSERKVKTPRKSIV